MTNGEDKGSSEEKAISGFIGGAKGAGGTKTENFEEAAEEAYKVNPDSFVKGAEQTHWSNPDVDKPPPGETGATDATEKSSGS